MKNFCFYARYNLFIEGIYNYSLETAVFSMN